MVRLATLQRCLPRSRRWRPVAFRNACSRGKRQGYSGLGADIAESTRLTQWRLKRRADARSIGISYFGGYESAAFGRCSCTTKVENEGGEFVRTSRRRLVRMIIRWGA
jgi:hypothetical protein